MRELAKELDVGESAATAVVDRLVRQGLVVRCDDPTDRRVVRLALSDTGESLVVKLHASACRKTADLLVSLSDEQLAQLVTTMEMLEAAAIANEVLTGCETAAQGQRPGGAGKMTTTDSVLGAGSATPTSWPVTRRPDPTARRRTRSTLAAS